MDQTNNHTTACQSPHADEGPPGLNTQQWRGLARLGEIVSTFDEALRGPLGAPASELAQAAGRAYAMHDLPALAEEIIETLAAWREAGLLRLLRDNAQPLGEVLALLAPLAGELVTRLRTLPAERLRDEIAQWQTIYTKVQAARGFLDGALAEELTAQLVNAGRFWQENNLEDALGDLLDTVVHIHESGMFARLREMADYLDASDRAFDRSALMADLVKAADSTPLRRVVQLMTGLDQAIDDAGRDEARLGGTGGLFHLLRDKQVQKGLRTLSVLPAYLEQMQHN